MKLPKTQAKTLNVMHVTVQEIEKNWGMSFPTRHTTHYARCNAKGEINWDKTTIYCAQELVGRQNVNIMVNKETILFKIESLSGNITGIYKRAHKLRSSTDEFAFNVAQQANMGPLTRKGANATVGKEIVKLCLQLYPNVKLTDKHKK